MPESLLLIPTTNVNLAERCLVAFYPALVQTSTTAIVIYNGHEASIFSDRPTELIIHIGYDDSERLAERFSELAHCSKALLFGGQQYHRSFGGAANLLLAVGCALGASTMAKIDDDCLELGQSDCSWLARALAFARHTDSAYFGHYCGQPSGGLHQLPHPVQRQLARFIYPEHEHSDRLGSPAQCPGRAVKNGNLVFPARLARQACYPVLFNPTTGIHLRGEAYHWMHALVRLGFSFTYQADLELAHCPRQPGAVNRWLRSIVAGFDLSYVDRSYAEFQKMPSRAERLNAIADFRAWIQAAEWPQEIMVADLVDLLEEDGALNFADKILRETADRKRAWARLMRSDLSTAVQAVLPRLRQRHQRYV